MFKGRGRHRVETPSVVHRSFEHESRSASSSISWPGERSRLPHPFRTVFTSRSRRTSLSDPSELAHPDHTTLSSRPEDERRARRGDVCSPHSSVFNDAHPRLVRLPICERDRGPFCSSVERFVHGETPGFGGPDVTPRACSTRGGQFQAEPLTPRRLHLGPGALSRPLPPLRPSPFPAPPREGGRLVTNKDALTARTSEEVLSSTTPLDAPR